MTKTLHFFWTSPDGSPVPADIMKVLERWRETHPNYEQKIWDTGGIKSLAEEERRSDIVDAINASRFPAMVSDIARLALLCFKGGVYSDLKNLPIVTFLDEFLEIGRPVVTQHPPTIPNHETIISNCFFCGSPGHPFFKQLLDQVIENVRRRVPRGVAEVTGGRVLMRVLGKPPRPDVVVKSASEVWGDPKTGRLMKRISASYNGPNNANHWSKLQSQGIYND